MAPATKQHCRSVPHSGWRMENFSSKHFNLAGRFCLNQYTMFNRDVRNELNKLVWNKSRHIGALFEVRRRHFTFFRSIWPRRQIFLQITFAVTLQFRLVDVFTLRRSDVGMIGKPIYHNSQIVKSLREHEKNQYDCRQSYHDAAKVKPEALRTLNKITNVDDCRRLANSAVTQPQLSILENQHLTNLRLSKTPIHAF